MSSLIEALTSLPDCTCIIEALVRRFACMMPRRSVYKIPTSRTRDVAKYQFVSLRV